MLSFILKHSLEFWFLVLSLNLKFNSFNFSPQISSKKSSNDLEAKFLELFFMGDKSTNFSKLSLVISIFINEFLYPGNLYPKNSILINDTWLAKYKYLLN